MSYPISLVKNDYNINKKNPIVETPLSLCKRIYNIIEKSESTSWNRTGHVAIDNVYDIACNKGNLSYYFKDDYDCIGIDIDNYKYHSKFIENDFLKLNKKNLKISAHDLILCNPPFNAIGKKAGLIPETFLKHIFKLWGEEVKVILFVPFGFRLNQRIRSKRWRWLKGTHSKITSILSLPIDIFSNVLFHSEILFFNIKYINPHYWMENNDELF